MALIPPFFLDCVVAIGAPADDGTHWAASGFLYGHRSNPGEEGGKTYWLCLVTNRHVFDGLRVAVLRFNPEAAEPARQYQVALIQPDGSSVWIGHPDPKIDVAVMAINGNLLKADGIKFQFFEDDGHTATLARMTELGIAEGDGVFALGFPLGLVGGDRNYVIVRQGVIARVRDTLASASSDFLVDMTIFPGNSGGPVILRPESTAIDGTLSQVSSNLLGIVSSYLPYQDIAISTQTKRPRIIFEENTGLASIFPVDSIDETISEHRRRGKAEAPPAPPEDNKPGERST